MNVLTGQEVVTNLCELLLSKFKILCGVALISDKVAYVGRIIISLFIFELFMSRNFSNGKKSSPWPCLLSKYNVPVQSLKCS